jgi:ubiquitin-like-conjugating enzyme ATG3
MEEHINNAVRLFRSTREWAAPVLGESAFLDRGVLTPEEFVMSGDHFTSCCPSWQWCEGDETKLKDYLPRKKQFLLTRGVPVYAG